MPVARPAELRVEWPPGCLTNRAVKIWPEPTPEVGSEVGARISSGSLGS